MTRSRCSWCRDSFVIRLPRRSFAKAGHSPAAPKPGEGGSFVIFRRRAFTLVELLVVLTTIMILTGMVLSAAGYVQKKGARTRAESEMAALTAALEAYKGDNGNYPRDPPDPKSVTDDLNAASNTPKAGEATSTDYQNASQFLYGQLSGDYDPNAPANNDTNYNNVIDDNEKANRVYFNFPPSMLSISISTITNGNGKGNAPAPDAKPSPPPSQVSYKVNFIRDPFGYPYGYSTAGQLGDSNRGYNPTYDLWSTVGTTCSDCSGQPDQPKCCSVAQSDGQKQWIKNW